ncbi:unnamed protein product [Moneuplotes crassus]|uniref:Uncharacterized protein n=1 Tax=Euplotes crassus TaxID=5936 RepID=A0AAD2D5Z5_EUPCR|nr:unnamed protein product [Moneuplotes crassus]
MIYSNRSKTADLNPIFGQINLWMVVLELGFTAYLVISNLENGIYAIPFLVIDLVPSILFHLDPNIIHNRFFRWFARIMSNLELGLIFIGLLVAAITVEELSHLLLIPIVLVLNATNILIPITMLIILNHEDNKSSQVVYLVPIDPRQALPDSKPQAFEEHFLEAV